MRDGKLRGACSCGCRRKEKMSLVQKRLILLLVIAAVGFVLGRLAVRAVMNLMLGGTLFGGNFL